MEFAELVDQHFHLEPCRKAHLQQHQHQYCSILYRKDIAEASDPDSLRKELVNDYTEKLSNPYAAAERGTIDSVIEPEDSRAYITKAFRTLKTKRDILPARKHGNIPL